MKRRRLLFIAITISFASAFALVVAEYVLRFQSAAIRNSESMDPGLIGYDSNLGWRIQSGWSGEHRHHDFRVRYQIADHGFRGPFPNPDSPPCLALVGDSFTFGLGVEDDQTFAHQLALLTDQSSRPVVNLGVPGYSTDQEVLLLEEVIDELKIDHVMLLVCLINDVFDNQRLFPLQAMHGKPRFRLDDDGELQLENVPVPMQQKPAAEMRENLASLVRGDLPPEQSSWVGWLGSREMVRRFGLFQPSFQPPEGYFEDKFASSLDLFDALIDRARQLVEASGAKFSLVLLPGQSLVEAPESFSGRYQEFVGRSIRTRSADRGVDVLDLTESLRQTRQAGSPPLYHAHDGHLNAVGHQAVAKLLHDCLE